MGVDVTMSPDVKFVVLPTVTVPVVLAAAAARCKVSILTRKSSIANKLRASIRVAQPFGRGRGRSRLSKNVPLN